MQNNFDSIDNLDTQVRKSSVVQERTGLVAVHMYKQFLDFQQSSQLTHEMFLRMIATIKDVVENLKQGFKIRNIPNQNVYFEIDKTNTLACVNILWHTITFTSRFNISPKALPREGTTPIFCGRIFALNGSYASIIQDAQDYDAQMKALLDNEIASLYVPADKTQSSVMTIRHKNNQEILISPQDASREFLLKVIEAVCAGGQFHDQGQKNKFTF